jgi:hypothetical protein
MKRIVNDLFIKNTENIFIQLLRYSFVGGIAAIVNFFFLFFIYRCVRGVLLDIQYIFIHYRIDGKLYVVQKNHFPHQIR